MLRGRVSAIASAARRIYRALVPERVRRAIRSKVVHPPPRPRSRPVPGPRRFELPLPRPDDGGVAPRGRDVLTIEAPSHFFVPRKLQEGGVAGYEAATAAAILGVADAIRPSVVFDVGANVGPHALLVAALLDVAVVAFEPAPDVAAVLRHVVALNDLRCTVVELALGEADGTATLFISPTDTSTSLRPGFRDATGEVSVAVRTLDSFIETSGLRPSLVKIDTETTEPAVLRGAAALLASRPWVVCEILPDWTEADIEGLLFPLGYAAYHIVDAGPPRLEERIAGNASFDEANWLFAPEEPSPAVWNAIARWRRAIDACALPQSPAAGQAAR